MIVQNEEASVSDSSNPSVRRQNQGNETEPYGGGSSASSLGAPEPAPDDDESTTEEDDSDVNGDPDQVT